MDGSLSVARLGTVDYTAALALQEAMVAARLRDEIGDTLLLLEHPHVYTLGRGADAGYIINPSIDIPIRRVSRGGQVTYHGPGQLVGYPILKLSGARRDVSRYLRRLELALIGALHDFAIEGHRPDGMTGVWVGPHKIGSIGVGIRRWVTLHGFAINVTTDLAYFDAIVPCGLAGCRMTSVATLCERQIAVADFADAIERSFPVALEYDRVVPAVPADLWRLLDVDAGDREVAR